MPHSFSTNLATLLLATPSLSPSRLTGSTLQLRNSATITATNSTCENFRPGQLLAPPDQATNGEPVFGNSSRVDSVDWLVAIQR